MPRPDKGHRSEIFNENRQFNYSDNSIKPYWQNEYHFTVKLLEQKMFNFIRLNERLRENISNPVRFLQVTEQAICFNLSEFKDAYQFKFIVIDFEAYCAKFVELFTPLLLDFLKEIGYGGYSFTFRLRLGGNNFEKRKSVMVDKPAVWSIKSAEVHGLPATSDWLADIFIYAK